MASRYRLIAIAGTGGFATVWRAYDRRKQHLVAVKILHGQWTNDASCVERFESGATRMDSLRHEAIVPMLGEPSRDEHHHFCVMQWFAGGDLDRAVRQGTIDRRTALAAVAQVAMGLAHAHAQGVIHRDVKPANILLDEQGRGCITDFDLARAKDSTHGTRTGGLGTFVYAAPEQQEDASRVDAQADVYGLGMCVLFVLAGKHPPPLVSRTQPQFVDKLDCGAALRAVLRLAVAYEARERTVTCEAIAAAVRGASSGPEWALEEGRDDYGRWASFRVGGVEQRMRWIEPGTFKMGSPDDEDGRDDNEGPQHEVTLTQGYWMAETPCTQALWEAVMGSNPSECNGPERPVEQVSWEDVGGVLARLNEQGGAFRLPTEAEWEYACRAGTTTATYGELAEVAWYLENSGYATQVVRTKGRNAWGLYDMLGNVWEWCVDGCRPYDATPVTTPTGPSGQDRVVRGGGWHSEPRLVRAAYRRWNGPGYRSLSLGFRLVRGQ